MNHEPPVARRQVEIVNALGLHLRPAKKFVLTADRFQAEIRIHYKGKTFNGRSILDLASLAAECGARIELEAIGPDAEAALAALAELIAAEFHEDEFGEDKPDGDANGQPEPASAPPPGPSPPAADPARPREPSP
jgi:phosphocarrier protein HPr